MGRNIMSERGVIEHRERAKQLRDFSGLRFGNITPTDIDGLIEYKNIAYVIIETKYGNAEVPLGQMIALERLCDDLQNYKHTLVILSTHNHPVNEDIDLANSKVVKYRYRKQWVSMKDNPYTVRNLVDWFFESDNVKTSKA
jgi:hypothetical protein